MLDKIAHLRTHPLRPTLAYARLGQLTQPAAGRILGRHEFARVFIAQLIERKITGIGKANRFGEQSWRIQFGESCAVAKVALVIGLARIAELIEGSA